MKNRFIRYMLWLAISTLLSMCKPGNAPTPQLPPVQCRIESITITYSASPTPTSIHFIYNNDGLLTEMASGNIKSVITYRSGKPYLLQTFLQSGGDWISQREVTLYSNGTLRDITALNNYPGAKPTSASYTKFSVTNTAIVGTKTVIEANLFSWDINGDMIRYVSEAESSDPKKGEYYTYYTDKEYAPKNVDAFTRYLSTSEGYEYIRLYGAPAYYTPHLLKEQRSELNKSTYEYDLDDDGKITKITITSDMGAKTIMTPTYECK